ncbi:MAG: hypothetical protein C0183_00460 [Roseiflexus castenholzii]|nr:MAG: hypothetical protein C0183_00460 [Roseiflexus castenholzii]
MLWLWRQFFPLQILVKAIANIYHSCAYLARIIDAVTVIHSFITSMSMKGKNVNKSSIACEEATLPLNLDSPIKNLLGFLVAQIHC